MLGDQPHHSFVVRLLVSRRTHQDFSDRELRIPAVFLVEALEKAGVGNGPLFAGTMVDGFDLLCGLPQGPQLFRHRRAG